MYASTQPRVFSNGVRALHARVFTPTVCVHCTQTWSMFQKRCSTSTDIAISKSKKESYFTNSTISSGFRIGMPLECSPAAPGAQRRAHAMMIDALSTVTDFVPEMMFRWFPPVCPTHGTWRRTPRLRLRTCSDRECVPRALEPPRGWPLTSIQS